MTFLAVIHYAGVFVFALTGAFKARAFKMDVFGGLVVAFVTAYGGGTVRDLLIGIKPVNWINDRFALILVFSAAAITFLVKDHLNKFRRTIFTTDAIGLGMFTAAGIEISLRHQVNDIYSLIMGVITATFGGLIADVFCNDIPNLFKRGELYATASAIGGAVYIVLHNFNFNTQINLAICVCLVIGFRIYFKMKSLSLPGI